MPIASWFSAAATTGVGGLSAASAALAGAAGVELQRFSQHTGDKDLQHEWR